MTRQDTWGQRMRQEETRRLREGKGETCLRKQQALILNINNKDSRGLFCFDQNILKILQIGKGTTSSKETHQWASLSAEDTCTTCCFPLVIPEHLGESKNHGQFLDWDVGSWKEEADGGNTQKFGHSGISLPDRRKTPGAFGGSSGFPGVGFPRRCP